MAKGMVSLIDAAGPRAVVSERTEADGRKTISITVPSPADKQIWIGRSRSQEK